MKKLLSIMSISLKNYHAFFGDIVGTNLILVLRIWILITLYSYLFRAYAGTDLLPSISFEEISFALIFAQIVSISKPKIVDEVSHEIKSGKVSILLLQPLHYIWFKFLQFFPIFLHQVAFGLVFGLTTGWILTGFLPNNFLAMVSALVLLIGAMLVSFFSYLCIGLLAFYTEDVEAFRFIYSKFDMILGGNILPLAFLPPLLQTCAYLSPFPYFGYFSGILLVSFSVEKWLSAVLIQGFWLGVTLLSCFGLFARAKRALTINGG